MRISRKEVDSKLVEAVKSLRYSSIYLIGGGGKTTLMYRLAALLAGQGQRVVATTSTKITLQEASDRGGELHLCSTLSLVESLLRERRFSNITLAKATIEESVPSTPLLPESGYTRTKLQGFSLEDLDEIQRWRIADYLLVEADGSAGRSIKAHAAYEPVISSRAGLVIAVIGVDCIGKPLGDDFVHRAALFSQRLGCPRGVAITAEHVARILLNPQGYLCDVSVSARVVVALTKTGKDDSVADEIEAWIQSMDSAQRIDGFIRL